MKGSLVTGMFVCVCMKIMCANTYTSQQGGVCVCVCVCVCMYVMYVCNVCMYVRTYVRVYECICIEGIFNKRGSLNYKN
jgi:hypothetical protein